MYHSRKIVLVAGLGLAAAVVGIGLSQRGGTTAADAATVQVAALSPADIIAERRKLMKGQGAAAKVIDDFVEGGTGTAADVAKAAASIKESSAKIPDLFPAGTSIDDNVAETHAKKEIWANFDDFKAHAAKLHDLATALEAAAQTGDKDQISTAFATMGKDGCGGCHTLYREKIQ